MQRDANRSSPQETRRTFLKATGVLAAGLYLTGSGTAKAGTPEEGLAGHWNLQGDCRDRSGKENHGVNHGVNMAAPEGARFDGRNAWIEVPDSPSLHFGRGDFSLAVWIHTEAELTDALGDVLSKYEPDSRNGVNLSIMNYAGTTSSQSNYRNLLWGIDAGKIDPAWTDCGRPGNSLYAMAMAVFDGHLYVGTYEQGEKETGHVYRYDGQSKWTDCGGPDPANAIASLAVFDGKLYAGSARYNAGGSALAKSPNWKPGGKVYCYQGGTRWTDCGRLGEANEVIGMAVFGGRLYATPLYREGKGLYRYEGGRQWAYCGNPGRRVQPLVVYNGVLYGGSYDDGHFVRYDGGSSWTDLGQVPETTQVYSFAIYRGCLYLCNWPTGSVFLYDVEKNQWTHVGRLGEEKEVMGVSVYNGKMYAGTLPLAAVYRFDGANRWTNTGRLDTTPDVTYRRVWSMAVFGGKLFAGTLPSGCVCCLEAGKSATYDRELAPGWRHVAGVKAGGVLKLYVDGQCVATSSPFNPGDYDLASSTPLRIGFGQHDYFNGRMKDLRLYRRALSESEIASLAARPSKPAS
jgi:hypothetical protein